MNKQEAIAEVKKLKLQIDILQEIRSTLYVQYKKFWHKCEVNSITFPLKDQITKELGSSIQKTDELIQEVSNKANRILEREIIVHPEDYIFPKRKYPISKGEIAAGFMQLQKKSNPDEIVIILLDGKKAGTACIPNDDLLKRLNQDDEIIIMD